MIKHYETLLRLRKEFLKKSGYYDIKEGKEMFPSQSDEGERLQIKLENYVKKRSEKTYHYLMKNDMGVFYACLADNSHESAEELSKGDKEKGIPDGEGGYYVE